MSDGLIDRLRDPGAESVGLGGYVHKDAVRDLLRSDETREALMRASFAALGSDPDEAQQWELPLHYDVVDAVVRVLTGGETDE